MKNSHIFRMIRKLSYVIFFVTARCNAHCKMCFYKENMSQADNNELTVEEYEKISKNIKSINVLGISGGEPFLRNDLSSIVKTIYKNCHPLVLDLPTNAFYVDSVLKQVEDIAKYCKDMALDIQLSIDGPEDVHDDIRGLKGSFNRVKEAYKALIALRSRYKNLRIKACVVYSGYNQDHIEELFNILDKDFKDLDRIVFSVAHGSVQNKQAMCFDWEKYFASCNRLRDNTKARKRGDLHSIFTIALRMAKNDLLKEVLKKKHMYKICSAGKRVAAVGESGEVFPCEPLWQSIGNLRDNDYSLKKILRSNAMKEFNKKMLSKKCNCHWGLPLSNSIIYTPTFYPRILRDMVKIAKRSIVK